MGVPKQYPSQVQFELGNYTAELLPSKTGDGAWYVVVQPKNSRQIVAIDRFPNYEEARMAVAELLTRMSAGPTLI